MTSEAAVVQSQPTRKILRLGPRLGRLALRALRGGIEPLVVLALFAAGAVAMTYPLVRGFQTSVLGWGDAAVAAWNYWWVRYALLDLHQWPFVSNYQFYPNELYLGFAGLTLGNSLLGLPLIPFVGVQGAVNTVLLFSLAFAGLGTYYLVRDEVSGPGQPWVSRFAGLLGGAIFTYAPNMTGHVIQGHYGYATTWVVPWFALAWLRFLRRQSIGWAVVAGFAMGFTVTVDYYKIPYIPLLAVALTALAWVPPTRKRFGGAVLAVVVSLVVASPTLVAVVQALQADYGIDAGKGSADLFAPDLLNFIIPNPFHPVWGQQMVHWMQRIESWDTVKVTFVGYATLAMALAGLSLRAGRRWIPVVLLFAVLTLGPFLRLNGLSSFDLPFWHGRIPLPFQLLQEVPLIGAQRIPSTGGLFVMLGLAVMAGAGVVLAARLHWTAAMAVGLIATGLVGYEFYPAPMPLTDLRVDPVFQKLAEEPGDFGVATFPLGWREGRGGFGEMHTAFLFTQVVHHRPQVNGYYGRVPMVLFDRYKADPVWSFLAEPQRPMPTDTAVVQARFAQDNVRFIIFRPGRGGDRVQEFLTRYAQATVAYRAGETLIYRLPIPAVLPTQSINLPPPTQPLSPSVSPVHKPDLVIGSSGKGPGQLAAPRGVAVGADGSIFVADTGNARIEKFDASGKFLIAWSKTGEAEFREPIALAFNRQGELLVLDAASGWVQRFDPNGRFLGLVTGPTAGLYHPRGLRVDVNDNVYIADTGNARVAVFKPDGSLLRTIGKRGNGPGEMIEPTDVLIRPDAGLLVLDTGNGRVLRLDAEGKFVAEWRLGANVAAEGPHLALAPEGSVYVTDPERHRVVHLDADLKLRAVLGTEGTGPGQFRKPVGVAVDGQGLIYIADTLNNRVQRFRP